MGISKNARLIWSLAFAALVGGVWLGRGIGKDEPAPAPEALASAPALKQAAKKPDLSQRTPVVEAARELTDKPAIAPGEVAAAMPVQTLEEQIAVAQEQLDAYHTQLANQQGSPLPDVIIGDKEPHLPESVPAVHVGN